ncbi:threonine--tRNA ligase mitochondrial 1-like [Prunus yedoensis var. nudiflora]|uniref:threonine--tRNA ligase n=1 Tax=Prunus yedoensis var. nudiflora TaxID=2094558 RepID=A0A314ZN43_PRUYE|nr:threonine--tRNA ligase mitochondrial 1-like [Prunus yedoensis var. nudiflora]
MVSHAKDDAYMKVVIPKRSAIFESIQAEQRAARQSLPSFDPIRITLPDGKVKEGKKWITSPFEMASEISKSLASNALISEVNRVLWDMNRPLEGDAELRLFTLDSFDNNEDVCHIFWHSCSHILGQALEMEYGCRLCIGPCARIGTRLNMCTTSKEGFYYDAFYGHFGLNDEHLKKIESWAESAIKGKQPFECIEVLREQALEMFCDNKFKASAAYWRGNKDRESLQRVYGISYPDKKTFAGTYPKARRSKKI